MKKWCNELVSFMTGYAKVASDQINCIMTKGSYGSTYDGLIDDQRIDDDDEKGTINSIIGEKEGMKLFSVWMNIKENLKEKMMIKKINRDDKKG